MYFEDYLMLIMFITAAVIIIQMFRARTSSKTTTASTSASASTAKPKAVSKAQMAEDIRATRTSDVADAVAILDDLGSTSSNYRHYCELIGTSMASSGIIAPYSKRPVAYYDIKCYRIDATYGGGQEETLVAHEHSFDPFFFTDALSDTPVYIDLESFGENVILVNSTNHIEGPNSDFAKAFQQNASTATSSGTAYAMVAHAVDAGRNALLGAADAIRNALAPQPVLQPAYALATGGSSPSEDDATAIGPKAMLASSGSHGGPGGPGSGRPGQGGRPPQRPYGGNQMPPNLGGFIGWSSQPFVIGGGYTTHRPTSTSSTDIILGMSLAALLNSMTTATTTVSTTGGSSSDTFRGYRLVENVVPLSSPIYCIGEIYRHGTDVYMGRSLAKDYPTSYFATKPESEVLSAIGA